MSPGFGDLGYHEPQPAGGNSNPPKRAVIPSINWKQKPGDRREVPLRRVEPGVCPLCPRPVTNPLPISTRRGPIL